MVEEKNFSRSGLSGEEGRLGVVPEEIHRERFFPGTLGFELFPPELEGRKRAVVWTRPLEWYRYFNFNRQKQTKPGSTTGYEFKTLFPGDLRKELAEAEAQTLADLLNKKEDDFLSRGFRRGSLAKVKAQLSLFFDQLTLGPEGLVLWAVFEKKPEVISQELDERRRKAVEGVVNDLGGLGGEKAALKRGRILKLRFGFDNGNPKRVKEVAAKTPKAGSLESLSQARTGEVLRKISRMMRSPPKARRLIDFHSPLPENCLARAVYGLSWPFQIDDLRTSITNRPVEDLYLSSSTLEEITRLQRKGEMPSPFWERKWGSLKEVPLGRLLKESLPVELSGEVKAEIESVLKQDFSPE